MKSKIFFSVQTISLVMKSYYRYTQGGNLPEEIHVTQNHQVTLHQIPTLEKACHCTNKENTVNTLQLYANYTF